MASFVADVAAALVRFVLSFYAFWLVWRVLLPVLPGPARASDRVAPFVGYFTDPFVLPVARCLSLPPRLVAGGWLVVVALLTAAVNAAAA